MKIPEEVIGASPAQRPQAAPETSGVARVMPEAARQVRALALVLILAVVAIVFQILTDGLFLTPRNLSVLSVQVAITAILAAGIVMIMVPAYIDLAIGAAVAFCAIITAVMMSDLGLSVWWAVAATLLVGAGIGIWHGFWVAVMGVPAFIVTLASLLGLRGLGLLLTKGETSAPGVEITFFANLFLSPVLTVALFLVLAAGFALIKGYERHARIKAGLDGQLVSVVVVPVTLFAVVCIGALVVFLAYNGLPLPVAILLGVASLVSLVLRFTSFGRHLYAMGGNREAAWLSGVPLRSRTFLVFVVMGVLYAVAGLILVARLNAAPPNAALGLELNVIAAAVIGGTSLLGGIGTVGGAVLGALLMESLNNGMSLMNLPSYYQQISVGIVLLFAVYADMRGRRA